MTNREFDLEEIQTQLRKTKLEVEHLKTELEAKKIEIAREQGIIAWMETSKFWKTRLKLLSFKEKFQQIIAKKPQSKITDATIIESTAGNLVTNLGIPRFVPEHPKVLLVVEESIPQCFRYRVQQKLEQLQYLEYEVSWMSWHDADQTRNLLHFYHIIIFYRVPALPEVLKIIKIC
ncbi:MAG: hypothetical protein HC908_05390 [Calothrix sp. SM1_7_51]|nr:hypothetical protein [Calothrix sp. SM1_7_51]